MSWESLRISFLVSLLAALCGLSACVPAKNRVVDNDPLEQSYRLMDKGETDEAIAKLEDLSHEDSRPEVRLALASAYAARAGLKIESYWNFISTMRAPTINSEQLQSTPQIIRLQAALSQADKHKEVEGADEVSKLAQMLATFQLWEARIDALPAVRGSKKKDLEHAWIILRDQPKAGDHLYRALMGLVLVKSDLQEGFDGWSDVETVVKGIDWKNPTVSAASLCTVNFSDFSKWSTDAVSRLSETIEDVTKAFPSKEPEMRDALVKSKSVARNFQRLGNGACQ